VGTSSSETATDHRISSVEICPAESPLSAKSSAYSG